MNLKFTLIIIFVINFGFAVCILILKHHPDMINLFRKELEMVDGENPLDFMMAEGKEKICLETAEAASFHSIPDAMELDSVIPLEYGGIGEVKNFFWKVGPELRQGNIIDLYLEMKKVEVVKAFACFANVNEQLFIIKDSFNLKRFFVYSQKRVRMIHEKGMECSKTRIIDGGYKVPYNKYDGRVEWLVKRFGLVEEDFIPIKMGTNKLLRQEMEQHYYASYKIENRRIQMIKNLDRAETIIIYNLCNANEMTKFRICTAALPLWLEKYKIKLSKINYVRQTLGYGCQKKMHVKHAGHSVIANNSLVCKIIKENKLTSVFYISPDYHSPDQVFILGEDRRQEIGKLKRAIVGYDFQGNENTKHIDHIRIIYSPDILAKNFERYSILIKHNESQIGASNSEESDFDDDNDFGSDDNDRDEDYQPK